MRLSHLLLSAPLFFAVACSSTPPPAEVTKPEPVIKKEFSRILESNYRGLLRGGDDKATFKTCDTNKEFTVHTRAALRNIYEQITPTKSTPVYIEFTGEIIFPNEKDKDSDVLMRIDRVHHMALAKASLQCAKPIDTFRFKAKGDDPYWRLTLNSQKLFFATKARNQIYHVKNANFKTTQINQLSSINEQGEGLNLTIKPGHCYNLKNREYWGYTAEVETIWGNLQGCGEPGWPILEQTFTGYYLSKTPSTLLNLTLNPDYSVEYSEKKGEHTTLKSGFWKSNSPDRVVVMLSRQENKNIREELIFQRQGLALSTTQINRNNIITELDAPGLIFNKMNAKEGVEDTAVERIDRKFNAQVIDPGTEVDLEVQEAVNQYFKIHRTDPQKTKFSSVKYDLNGDGIEEAIVLLDWCSNQGCEMLIFEGQKNGYRFSSRISRVRTPIVIAQTQHYLWQSLLIEKNAQSYILDFDGISYPIHTRDLKQVKKEDYATGVILFNQGIPKNWFPIKQ